LNKQYVALGERNDYIGGLGAFIDYENSKYLREKTGKLLPLDEQKLYRRLFYLTKRFKSGTRSPWTQMNKIIGVICFSSWV